MCGPYDSVLGVKKEIIIQRLWKQTKLKHEVDLGENALLNGLIFELNDQHKITSLQRLYRVVKWR
jgi:calcineurin-like phosphoesterase